MHELHYVALVHEPDRNVRAAVLKLGDHGDRCGFVEDISELLLVVEGCLLCFSVATRQGEGRDVLFDRET
jgi:hypothetical protein